MSLKKMALWLVIVAAAGVAAWAATRVWLVRTYAQSDVTVSPYLAQMVSFEVSNGKELITERTIESRRRDGSVHREFIVYKPDGTEAARFRRVDFADGSFAGLISDALHTKSTGHIPQGQLAAWKGYMQNPPTQCQSPGQNVDGEENLFGYTAIRLMQQPPNQQLRRYISWDFPDFNCATLQFQIQERASASAAWETTLGTRLISFTESDPSAALFDDWQPYEEMKPSDIKRRMAISQGLTPATCPHCFSDDKSDAAWQQQHPE